MTVDYNKIIHEMAAAIFTANPTKRMIYSHNEIGDVNTIRTEIIDETWEECAFGLNNPYIETCLKQAKAAFAVMQDNLPAISEYEEPIDIAHELYNLAWVDFLNIQYKSALGVPICYSINPDTGICMLWPAPGEDVILSAKLKGK